jgi:hypothetical protein
MYHRCGDRFVCAACAGARAGACAGACAGARLGPGLVLVQPRGLADAFPPVSNVIVKDTGRLEPVVVTLAFLDALNKRFTQHPGVASNIR